MNSTGAMDRNNTNSGVPIHMSESWRRRLRSLVWNDFTKEQKADGNYVAICNHCKRQFSASGRSGTTHLKNHLATCLNTKVGKRRKLVVRRVVLKNGRNDATDTEVFQFNQDLSYQDLARMIVYHGYRFSVVHDVGFKVFVKNLQPQFKFISEDVIKAECMKIYEGGRIKLRASLERLSCRVSLTVKMWRLSEDLEYVCLSCHYVDDDSKLKKKILNFSHVETLSSAKDISKIIAEKLMDWNLHSKLAGVILDNFNESDMLAEALSEILKRSSLLHGEFFHLRTAATVLNVIAQDITRLVCDIVSKVWDHVRSSKATPNRFLDVQSSRWDEIYLMLKFACDYQAYLTERDSKSANSLSSEEWDLAETVTECLCVFYDAREKFSGAKITMSNLYFNDICGIHLQLKTWKASKQPVIAAMASLILENFEQYWGKLILLMAVASVLDPRYKMKSVEYYFKKIYDDKDESDEKIESIRKFIADLYNEYVTQSNNASNDLAFSFHFDSNSGGCIEMKAGEEPTASSQLLFDVQRGLDQYLQETSSGQPQKSDLDLYLDEAVFQFRGFEDNFDILAWWKFHAANYPVLSIMARDILGIPLSIIATDIESGDFNQDYRVLDPATVQGLICGQDWLKDEFEETRGPAVNVATVPLSANLDADVDECMIPENRYYSYH